MERVVPTALDVPTGIVALPNELRAASTAPKLMTEMTCIEDLREAARRRVPRVFNDYLEAGSYAEQTLRANRADLERITLKQRVLVDVEKRDTATTILGEKVSLPVALAPIGLGGM